MSIALPDLHIKYLIEYGISEIRANPERYIKDIFCDASLPAHDVIYGNRMFERVDKWLKSTKFPVVLGWDLEPTQVPGITVALGSNGPFKKFLGDTDFDAFEVTPQQDREVLIPLFQPKETYYNDDRSRLYMVEPDSFTDEQKAMLSMGVHCRDGSGAEYLILTDEFNKNYLAPYGDSSLESVDTSSFTIITPYIDSKYRRGSMMYEENVIITIHGSQASNEGLWLWAMVMWILNRHRLTLAGSFGLDMGHPTSSDMIKQDGLEGTNVWRRFINLTAKAMWSWEESKYKDVIGFMAFVKADNQNGDGPVDLN